MNKKLTAIISAATFVVGAAGGIVFTPAKEVIVPTVNQTAIDLAVAEALNNVEPVVINETVFVDNDNLSVVLEHIFDNNGEIEYLTSDLDDDEVDKIVERVVFINEAKKLAADAVRDGLFDELDNVEHDDVVFDDKEMSRLRVDDDEDEICIEEVDFDNKDAEVKVTGSFEQDDVKYYFEAIVEFKDGEVDEIKSIDLV